MTRIQWRRFLWTFAPLSVITTIISIVMTSRPDYTYIPTTDGKTITIPYSRPNKVEYAKKVITGYPEVERKIVEELLAKKYYGEKTNAGNWHWVDVVNIDPVQQQFRNGWAWLAYGETCGAGHSDYGDGHVVEGGTIQVRGEANGKVLYEYTARGNPMGTPCPSGILFFDEKEGR